MIGDRIGGLFFARMISLARIAVAVMLIVAARVASAEAPAVADDVAVQAIEIVGNRRVDSAAIRAQLSANVGRVSRATIADDIRAIYRTGFFVQAAASVVTVAGGRTLRYTVTEKPVVRKVFIKGNKEVDEKDLSEVIKFSGGRFLDRGKIEALMRNAVSYYQAKGFFDAALEYSVVPASDNQVDLTFAVKEGVKYKISEIRFTGLQTVDPSDLRSVMQTRQHVWYSSWLLGTGRLNKEMLENDKGLLRQWFLDHGYIDATVSDAVIDAKDGEIVITLDLSEGPQYKIGALTASGDLLPGGVDETIAGAKSVPGEIFNATQVREDTFAISDKFSDIGFAFANVVPGTDVDRASATVNLNYQVTKGNPVSINRIKIRGNEKTYDNVIRRELKVEEQSQFSGTKVKRSQKLLERLGYFEEVNIATEPGEQPDTVDLAVNVREGSTGTFSAGVGYSSSDGALFNARLSENNLFGTGRSASINVDIGSERDNIVLSYNDRRFNDTYLALGADLLRSEREFDDFDRLLLGGGMEVGYPLEELVGEWGEDISLALQYEYLNIEISNVDRDEAAQLVIDSEGDSTSSALTPKIVRNTINNPLNPSSGSKQVLSFEYAGPGGNQEYYLFEARQQWYYPVWRPAFGEFVFSWRASLGYGDTFDDEPFPLFKRFFPGGINSVRGYKNRSLGPEDERGNEYGGSKQVVNNLEFILPLVNSAGLKAVVFYDMGEAFDDDQGIRLGDLRRAYGYGLRWASPLGPIRIEFGFPADRQPGEKSMVTLFSFGAPL